MWTRRIRRSCGSVGEARAKRSVPARLSRYFVSSLLGDGWYVLTVSRSDPVHEGPLLVVRAGTDDLCADVLAHREYLRGAPKSFVISSGVAARMPSSAIVQYPGPGSDVSVLVSVVLSIGWKDWWTGIAAPALGAAT